MQICDIGPVETPPRRGYDACAMDGKRTPIRRTDVLKKLNAENLLMIERGLLGDLPERLKPQPFIPRSSSAETSLELAKPTGFLSSCLPMPDSPGIQTPSSDDEAVSPLKKSFSFRDKFSRISLFGKDKDRHKWKAEENEKSSKSTDLKRVSKAEYDYKSQKRHWFFRNKELEKTKSHSPAYQRSKSFEFLPRAIQEEDETPDRGKNAKRKSFVFDSDSMGDAWTSNESLEYISNVYYDNDDGIFLKSIREFPSESSGDTSLSTPTSASSANVDNIFKRGSVQDLLDEFNKAVDMLSEAYLSDCEPYTKSEPQLPKEEKRKSNSFSTLPSPKVLQVNKVSEISEEFKRELSMAVSVKPLGSGVALPRRRGSVTDWFVLEVDPVAGSPPVRYGSDQNKYRRGQKKPINRVRRISSTKYRTRPALNHNLT